MNRSKKTVIVIHDNDVAINIYEDYFSSQSDYILAGFYDNYNKALNDCKTIYPDIIIIDLASQSMVGVNNIKLYKQLDFPVKVLLVSAYKKIDHVLGAIKNNVDGYLTKPINSINLFNALNNIVIGGMPLSPDVSRRVVDLLRVEIYDVFENNTMFSKREKEILKLFVSGYTYKAMAETLYITHSTVNFHIQNIYTKLDVTNKYDALKKINNLG